MTFPIHTGSKKSSLKVALWTYFLYSIMNSNIIFFLIRLKLVCWNFKQEAVIDSLILCLAMN